MMKRLLIWLAILAGLAGPVHAAGTIAFSLSQQLDQYGKPLSGCKFYTIQAGTTSTPQNAYQDAALTLALPNPMTCDASGRLPQFFLADGSIKVRLTDKLGVTQVVADGILVIGPSSGGGGGGGGVDPTTVFQTGDVMWLDVQGTRAGWVRDNGRTIGSASSGATERANADTEALFNYLWQTFDNTICPVTGGRGASSAADWAANKTIQLPNKRNVVAGGLDDMGNAATGGFANVPVVFGTVTTPGSVIGEALHSLLRAELPATAMNTIVTAQVPAQSLGTNKPTVLTNANGTRFNDSLMEGSGSGVVINPLVVNFPTTNVTISGTLGSGTAMNIVQKTVLGTFYRKL